MLSYFIFLILNQLLVDYSLCYTERPSNRFQFNHSHYKSRQFKKHPTGYRFEEKHAFDSRFVVRNKNRQSKRRRNRERTGWLQSNKQFSIKHLKQFASLNSTNNYERENRVNKRRKHHHRNRNKKVVDDGEPYDEPYDGDAVDETNLNKFNHEFSNASFRKRSSSSKQYRFDHLIVENR